MSSVCNVRAPYSGDWNFRQCFYAIWYICHPWPFDKNFTDIVPRKPLRRGLNARGVAKYSDFGPFQGYISETVKIHLYFLQRKYRSENVVFISDISLRRYLQGITPSESVKARHSPLASENLTITRKRCKIGGKLVLITIRKSYMSFRLVLKSVTLNDLERRNGRYIALFQRIW